MPIQIQIITAFLLLRGPPRRRRGARPRRRAGRADGQRDLPRRPRRGRRRGGRVIIAKLNSNAAKVPADDAPRARRPGLVATVIVLPALLLSFWLVLQYADRGPRPPRRARPRRRTPRSAAASGRRSRGAAAERSGRRRRRCRRASRCRPRASTAIRSPSPSTPTCCRCSRSATSTSPSRPSAPIERFVPQPERP